MTSSSPDSASSAAALSRKSAGVDCGAMGRRYIGCALAEGGSLKIVA
jgi:hypothetical protein